MAKYAISQEGAEAMMRLSANITAISEGIKQATATLKNQIMKDMDALGVYGIDIWAMILQIDGIIEDRQEAFLELSEAAKRMANDILAFMGDLNNIPYQTSAGGDASKSATIAGTVRGREMSFEEADSGNVNPNYGVSEGFSYNCQSCVATFEARLRGYDVQVLPYTRGSMSEILSHQTNLIWIDPKTGQPPNYIFDESRTTASEYVEFMDGVVEQGNRYTIQFLWKGRGNGGHIVNLDRNEAGELRLKDNQRGIGEQSEWLGIAGLTEYFQDVKFKKLTEPCVPRILRIDNMQFNIDVANQIMEGAIS